MTLEITTPRHFRHAGELSAQFDPFDPRRSDFGQPEVSIDLRDCEFVRPPAALWCMVYLALALRSGSHCRLLVPQNMGVCLYLNSLGLFDLLKRINVGVDDRGTFSRDDPNTILPLSRFETSGEASDLTNRAFDSLHGSSLSAANLATVVTELFGELALNAAQHSESPVGAFACIQFFNFGTGPRLICSVADGGIGVRESLCRNPSLRSRINYDWDALELAVRERVSGTADPHRGIGLYGVSEDVRRPQHSLLLHSGMGSLEISEDMESAAKRTRLFPGPLASLAVPA